jgi:multiple sugar transport system permease protein
MLASGMKSEHDVLSNPLSLIPTTFEFGNFVSAFHTIAPYLWNSVYLAILNVIGVLVVSSLAGYAFGRLEFFGKNVLFGFVLATTMVPSIAYLIPQYLMFDDWGWINTHFPLWVPRVMTPVFGTFLMRQAFRVLPRELEDAARVDGASVFRTYWQVLLPLTRPALAAIAVLTFVESWNDLFGPLIFINSSKLQTLPAALALFQGEFFTQINLLMAAATISVIPVLLVYFLGQRFLVQGVANTGTTG